jgi:hypothetical protein
MQISSLPTNSSLQNTPRYQFSLKSETIHNLTILLNKIVKLSMVSDFNENWYLGLFWSVELIGNDENWIFIEIREHWNFADFVGGHFENKNDPECNFHHYQSIPHFKITLDINFHWNRTCIQDHFYEATIFKMAANKIGKISMFSNFNENWYLGLFWSEELIGNDENCIQGHFYDATVSKMAAN